MERRHHCPYCDFDTKMSEYNKLETHIRSNHSHVTKKILARAKAEINMPGVDLTKVVDRYKNKLETLRSLKNKKINIVSLLSESGIKRITTVNETDLYVIHEKNNGWIQSVEDTTKYLYLVSCRKGVLEKKLDSRIINKKESLIEEGVPPELFASLEAILRIEFIMKQQNRAQAEIERENNAVITMAEIRQNRAMEERRGKRYLIDPDGVTHEYFNLSDFCRQHNLYINAVFHVIGGRRPHHKGWRVIPKQEKIKK